MAKAKRGRLSAGVKASIAFLLASIVSKGITYLTTPVFTRLLTTEEYGEVAVYMTWVQLLGIVAMFCLSYGVFNNGMVDYPEKRNEYMFSMLGLSNVITLVVFVITMVAYAIFGKQFSISLPLLLLMFSVFLVQPAYNFWSHKERYELKYKWMMFWSIFMGFLSPVISIICILLNRNGSNLYPRIFGSEIPLIIVYIGFYIYLGSKSDWKCDTRFWRQAFLFNLPLIPHYLSPYLLNSSDRIMISYLVSNSATAFYTVAYSISAIAMVFWTAINGSLIPYTYENCKKNNFEAINSITMALLTAFGVICITVMLLAPEAIYLIATRDYYEAIYVIPPIIAGVFFQVQYYVYANILYYYKKPKYVMFGSVSAVTINLILNYIYIQKYGYKAAGYTTLICFCIQALIDYYGMKTVLSKDIYNMKYIVSLSIAVVIICLLSIPLYDFTPWIRYIILILIAIVSFLSRNKLIGIWKKMKSKCE